MWKLLKRVFIGIVLFLTAVIVACAMFNKAHIIQTAFYYHRSVLGYQLSDPSLSTEEPANVNASTTCQPDFKTEPESSYHRIDTIPEKTEKLPFLKNFKNPCWREAIGGNYSKIRCLPYFHLIGAAKCGTTDLHRRLTKHQHISSTVIKEIQWISHRKFEANLTNYLRYFDTAVYTDIIPSGHEEYHNAILGDFSPTTFWKNDRYLKLSSPKFTSNADVIHHLNPATKILVTIRNPVERSYSDFKHYNRVASPDRFHSTVVEIIRRFNSRCKHVTHLKSCIDHFKDRLLIGIYYVHIEDFLKVFPRKQIFITKLEDRSKNMERALNEIFSFLEIEPLPDDITADIVTQDIVAKNTSGRPAMLDKTKLLLEDFFRPFNEKLGELIGQEFNYNINK